MAIDLKAMLAAKKAATEANAIEPKKDEPPKANVVSDKPLVSDASSVSDESQKAEAQKPAAQLSGTAALIAALKAKKQAQKPTEQAKPAKPAAILVQKEPEASEASESLPKEILEDADELALQAKELAVIEVFDAKGLSLGSFTYTELKAKIEGFAKLAKVSKLFQQKLELFEAKKFELEQMAEEWAAKEAKEPAEPIKTIIAEAVESSLATATKDIEAEPHAAESFALDITLNANQQRAAELALAGKSFVLIGAAGTGKTTCQRAVASSLLEQGLLKDINFSSKVGESLIAPSFAAVAFTRRASGNLRKAIHKDPALKDVFQHNILTIHALLEYEPVFYFDEVLQKETMRFLPRRNSGNLLEITHLVVEEASMVGAYDLWQALYEALPEGVQIIFIGDINQLPPVFGPSILNYALVQLPVVELTEVYRQAGDSGILANAHQILQGKELLPAKDVHIISGKNPEHVGQEKTSMALNLMFKQWFEQGIYDPEEDMILSPYNEQPLGTIAMNNWIAQFLGEKRNAVVYEIIAGFNKHYLAVGDKVMYNKRDGIITKITHNAQYMGKLPQAAGAHLTRFGVIKVGAASGIDIDEDHPGGYANFSLDTIVEDKEERKVASSHIVHVQLEDGGLVELTSAGDFSPQVFSLGYVLTGHKAQGCEWRKVFIILHPGHRTMIFREWLYTSWTRAREELFVIAKPWLLEKAIQNPRIKGNSLEDKIAYFNNGLGTVMSDVFCTK